MKINNNKFIYTIVLLVIVNLTIISTLPPQNLNGGGEQCGSTSNNSNLQQNVAANLSCSPGWTCSNKRKICIVARGFPCIDDTSCDEGLTCKPRVDPNQNNQVSPHVQTVVPGVQGGNGNLQGGAVNKVHNTCQ